MGFLDEVYERQVPFKDEQDILALIEIMVLMIKSNGFIDPDEAQDFFSILFERDPFQSLGEERLLRMTHHAGEVTSTQAPETVIENAKQVLSQSQKELAFELAYELGMIDDKLERLELDFLKRIQAAFGISEETGKQIVARVNQNIAKEDSLLAN